MKVGDHVVEDVASRHHETDGCFLSVRSLAGFHGEHHANVFLSRRRPASNTKWMTSGHNVLEEAVTHHHDMLRFVLSVRTLAGLHGQHGQCLQGFLDA